MTGTWATGWATGDIVTAAEYKKSAGAIFDTTLGGSAANIDVTSISATYAHLLINVYGRGDQAAAATSLVLRFNGDTGANYDSQVTSAAAAANTAAETFAATTMQIGTVPANTAGANLFSAQQIFVPHYAGAANNKSVISHSTHKTGTASTNLNVQFFGGAWRSNAAINQVTLFPATGNFVTGTRVTIYAMGA